MAKYPPIAVAPSRYEPGIDSLSDPARLLNVVPFWDAFERYWETDAHFVCYQALGCGHYTVEGLDTWPRLNKPVYRDVVDAGVEIETTMFVLDLDTPDHVEWTDSLWDQWRTRWLRAQEKHKLARRWTCWYSTAKGVRIVYVLREPLPAPRAEALHKTLVRKARKWDTGMEVDRLSDWTRLFRLPKVVREWGGSEDKATWEEPHHLIHFQRKRIDAEKVLDSPGTVTVDSYGKVNRITRDAPGDFEARGLLKTPKGTLTAWGRRAKKRLRGRRVSDVAFDDMPLARKGNRDSEIQKLVGEACAMLSSDEDSTPEHIYGLLLDPVLQLVPDRQTPDWRVVLWKAVRQYWAKEEAKLAKEAEQAEEDEEDACDKLAQMLEGVREWTKEAPVHDDEERALAWLYQHLILGLHRDYFVMRPEGVYDRLPVNKDHLIPKIKQLEVDTIIPVTDEEGAYRAPKDIINDHCSVISEVRGVPAIKGSYLEQPDTPDAALVVSIADRKEKSKLVPEWNSDVDEWLRRFAGDNYELLCQWIAHALAFDEGPICALSLAGPADAGKKLLVQGLVECLQSEIHATGRDLVSNFQYGLLKSPFLVVNEGMPRKINGLEPHAMFRHLVGGDTLSIEAKFKAPIRVNNPVRVIFTANNLDVVKLLCGSHELSPEDREALAQRLVHIPIQDEVVYWLRKKGGKKEFTGVRGRRWIRGDGNQPSDYVVAKHFMWLYQTRSEAPGQRFLVEGNRDSDIMFELQTTTGSAPLVIETLIRMINHRRPLSGLAIEGDKVFVVPSEILTFFRDHISVPGRSPSMGGIRETLRGLVSVPANKTRRIKSRPELAPKRWHEIDASVLLGVAERDGWECPRLYKIVHGAKITGMPKRRKRKRLTGNKRKKGPTWKRGS